MPNETHRFLSACIRGDEEAIHSYVQAKNWNWDSAIHAASEEGLLAALNSRRFAFGDLEEDVAAFLAEVEASNRQRNDAIVEEVRQVAFLLNQIGIQPVLLKGVAYLATNVYQDAASRYIGDIDLLIPEAQLEAAVAELRSNGYSEDQFDPFGDYRHHHRPLARPGCPPVELHRSLGTGKCTRVLPADEVLARSEEYCFGDAVVRIPCPEHLLTHLVTHSQVQHAYTERIWPPLRAMNDLLALQARYGSDLNWQAVNERFQRAGLGGVLPLHLLQVSDSIGVAPPARFTFSPLLCVRWFRRRLLRRFPVLRYIDPIYMFSTVFSKRLLLLQALLTSRTGLRHLSARIVEPHVYLRLWTDLMEGRGR